MRALRTSAEASWRDELSLIETVYRIQSKIPPRIVREPVSAAIANCPRDPPLCIRCTAEYAPRGQLTNPLTSPFDPPTKRPPSGAPYTRLKPSEAQRG
jgi:hypothetical protein